MSTIYNIGEVRESGGVYSARLFRPIGMEDDPGWAGLPDRFTASVYHAGSDSSELILTAFDPYDAPRQAECYGLCGGFLTTVWDHARADGEDQPPGAGGEV